MAINFDQLSKTPNVFRQLTGLTVIEFQKVVDEVFPEWEKHVELKKCDGRHSHVL